MRITLLFIILGFVFVGLPIALGQYAQHKAELEIEINDDQHKDSNGK